jgi:hypothetical protein
MNPKKGAEMAARTKPVTELSEKELRRQIDGAEKEFRQLDGLDAGEIVRAGDTDATLSAMARAAAVVDQATAELARRDAARAAKDQSGRSIPERMRLSRAVRESTPRSHPGSQGLEQVLRLSYPELHQGVELDVSRLSDEEGEELTTLVGRKWAAAHPDTSEPESEPLSAEDEKRVEELLGACAGDRSFFRRKRKEASIARARNEIRAEARRDPRARSVTAALFSDPWLADALTERLRDDIRIVDQRGGERHLPKGTFTKLRLLQPQDLAVLALAAFAIEYDKGVLDGSRGLFELDNFGSSLQRLRMAGLMNSAETGPWEWTVTWGKRALRIAKAAGVELGKEAAAST